MNHLDCIRDPRTARARRVPPLAWLPLTCALLGLPAVAAAQAEPAPAEPAPPSATPPAEPAAAPTPAPAEAPPAVDTSFSTDDLEPSTSSDDSSAFVLAGKIGGIASFNGLDPFVHGGIELGWIFAGTERRIGALLQVEYSAPPASGSVTEEGFDPARVPDNSYDWEMVQKELVFQPTFLYRLTGISDSVTPYGGLGPRIYLLETVVRGSSGGETIGDTTEQSTKFGFGVPLGAEIALGPGGLFAELLFQWAPFDHTTTGDTHLGGLSLFLGYRALL